LSLEDAVKVIYHRGRLMQRTTGEGKTVAVELPLAEAERAIAGYETRSAIAAHNSPGSVTISGEPAAIDELMVALEKQQVLCRPVRVNYAFHSPQMTPLQPELISALAGIRAQAASIPIYSTVSGARARGEEFDANYWSNNMRRPVLFAAAVDRL